MDTHRKLKFTEKLSYGIADLPEAANSIIAAFLTMFYTDNIGLAAEQLVQCFLSPNFLTVSPISLQESSLIRQEQNGEKQDHGCYGWQYLPVCLLH